MRIVVGRHESMRVLDEVAAQEEEVAAVESHVEIGEETATCRGIEVADGASQEGNETWRPLGERLEVVEEVGNHGVDVEAGERGHQPSARLLDGL